MSVCKEGIIIRNLSKGYAGRTLFRALSLDFKRGGVYCIMGVSGVGKTTLFRMMAGLEQPDAGTVSGVGKVSAVFQEDRLIETLSAADNVRLVQKRADERGVMQALAELLPDDCLIQPVRELSGGMRRRAALGRAMLAKSDTILLDEPFSGLDTASKNRAVCFIRKHRAGRTLVLITHDRTDAAALDAAICLLTTD